MSSSVTGAHFPPEVMRMGVRWDVASPLSTRHVEERMQERGVTVEHATINRETITYGPLLEEALHRRKRPVRVSWRMDETDIKGKGPWRSRSRAVDTHGQTMDLLLTAQRDKEAARRLLKQAMRRHGAPETRTMDGSDAKEAASKSSHAAHDTPIAIRQGHICA